MMGPALFFPRVDFYFNFKGRGPQSQKLYTSWPPQEKFIIWPPFFEYNERILRQKTGGACLYMPQDGHWLASFEVIPSPPKS